MKLVNSTLFSATALALALSFTAVQAEPQQGGMSSDGPSAAGSNAAGGHPDGAMGSPEGGPAAAAGDSGQMNRGEGKGKSAEGTLPSEGPSGDDTGMATDQDNNAVGIGDKGKGKTAEDTMPSGKTKGQGTAESADDNMSGKPKAGATAEGKGDRNNRPGKTVRLESNDVSKVRTYFSQHRPSAKRIDRNEVSVSIGIGIPSAIALYDLPPDVIVVSGACPIKYFVWDDDIVLVDSCTREVVEIISGVA